MTDFTLAKENQTSFEEYLKANLHANPGIDLTVTVTTGFWPSYKSFDLNLPTEMVYIANETYCSLSLNHASLIFLCEFLSFHLFLFLGQVCWGFQGVLPDKNKAQKTYMDILTRNV